MTLRLASTAPASTSCDALVVVVGTGPAVLSDGIPPALASSIVSALETVGAKGAAGEVTRLPAIDGVAAPLLVCTGVGKDTDDPEAIRRAVGNAVRTCTGRRRVAIAAPAGHVREAAMAARLAAYSFTAFKGRADQAGAALPERLTVLSTRADEADRAAVAEVEVIADSVALVRDLVNTPPNALPPAALAEAARKAAKGVPVKVKVWDEKALVADGCGGILAVGQGSVNPPRLVRLDYSPARAVAHLALVGKGITFDTGGISIKPAASMDEMKSDMAGAAAVIGAVRAIAALKLPIRVTGWVPTAENMPSGTAQRPGDVITMYGGTTVEVLNTDAEGRLILADALGMAAKAKPDLIVDAATLTGAARIALGSRIAGVMGNDDSARTRVVEAAGRAGEEAWPMPLPADLRPALDSATADIANIGDRFGGMLSAGVFLSEFVPAGQPWVHVDIAGPAFNEKGAYGYTPKGGTGAIVRTFVQLAVDMVEQAGGARVRKATSAKNGAKAAAPAATAGAATGRASSRKAARKATATRKSPAKGAPRTPRARRASGA